MRELQDAADAAREDTSGRPLRLLHDDAAFAARVATDVQQRMEAADEFDADSARAAASAAAAAPTGGGGAGGLTSGPIARAIGLAGKISFNTLTTTWTKEFPGICIFHAVSKDCSNKPCKGAHTPPDDAAIRVWAVALGGTW
jgi:hypothetical protein